MAGPGFSPLRNVHPVVRVAMSTAFLVMAFSLCAPVLAVKIQHMGHGPAVVGAFAMIGFACIALLIPFMPRMLARVGEFRAVLWGSALEFAATVAFAATDSLPLWCVFAVLGSCGGAACWNATEALIARHSPPERRGRMAGLYQTGLGGVMALGPFLPTLWKLSADQALMLAAAVQGLGVLVVAGLRDPGPEPAGSHIDAVPARVALSTWHAFLQVPALAALAFAGGAFEAGLGSVSAANAASLGMDTAKAITVVGALGLGSFLFQYPAGWLADHFNLRRVFGSAGAILLASSLALLLVPGAPWVLWASAFCWGGVGGALYTLTMIRAAHRFKGPDTMAGSASMILGYTLGGALGPPIAGGALQWGGLTGLVVWLALLSVGVMGLARQMPAPPAASAALAGPVDS
ncbi:MAG: hypothetical protein RLZZ126_729 [Pseudomonadota bacterium]|jgi:MFS family permease